MAQRRIASEIWVVLAGLCAAAVFALLEGRPAGFASAARGTLSPPIALPAPVRRAIAFGFSAVGSDWYWLEAIQYFGSKENADEDYRHLSEFLEAATDLDPDFGYAFQFGGETIPFDNPRTKKWYNTGAVLHLLRKGADDAASPWEVPFLLGYSLYTFRGEYEEAGRYIEKASRMPDAPGYLRALAIRLLAQGGSVDMALSLTRAALANATEETVKADLEDRLKALTLQKDLDALNEALSARTRADKTTASMEDLVGYGGLTAVPPEPFGGRWEFDEATARVKSSDDWRLLRVFVKPGRPPIEPWAD